MNTKYINIETAGAIAGSNTHALNNYNVIVAAIAQINAGTATGIYIPRGTFYTNELRTQDGLDLRYFNIRGESSKHSVLKLADNRNKSLIESDMLFETTFEDVQFNGNVDYNPNTDVTFKLSGGNCYSNIFNRVYFRDHNIGLMLNKGQAYTLNNVWAKYGNVGGILLDTVAHVTITDLDAEQNGGYGLCVKSDKTEGYRYKNPMILIDNAYCESNDIGILLAGVCNVEVRGGYRYGGVFAKVTNDKDSYSKFNRFSGKHTGQIIITEGNYGNEMSPSYASFVDLDGRNVCLDEEVFLYALPTITGNATNVVTNHATHIEVVGTASNQSAHSYDFPNTTDKALYLKIKGDMNTKVKVRVYCLNLKKYLNFSTWGLETDASDENVYYDVLMDGTVQYIKVPLELSGMVNPRVQVKYGSKSSDTGVLEAYGIVIQ